MLSISSCRLAGMLLAIAPSVTAQMHCVENSYPGVPGRCTAFSIGRYQIWIVPAFRTPALQAAYPYNNNPADPVGYDPNSGVLHSGPMFEGGTVPGGTIIAHSGGHLHGSAADTAGVQVDSSTGPFVSDCDFTLQPPGFQSAAGPTTREVHTQIMSMNLVNRQGFMTSVRTGAAAPALTRRSVGEVQALGGTDFPARSFFDIFVHVDLPLLGGATPLLENRTALLVQNSLVQWFPPSVVYLHENSTAVPVYFVNANPPVWSAGDLLGFLVLSGHGVGDGITPPTIAQLNAALAGAPVQAPGEGGDAGPSGPVGLALISGPTPSTAFNATALGVTSIAQVSMVPHPDGRTGEFLGGLSVTGLPASLGGVGGYDVVAFTYNRLTNTVTLNNKAAVFNSAADEFALNWSPDATYAVCDRVTGTPAVLQAEVGTCGTLTNLRPVAGIGGVVDPCPAEIGGYRVLFFNDAASGISYRRHDVTAAQLLASPPAVSVSQPSVAGRVCHSAWPIPGGDGEVTAMLGCELSGSVSIWNWQGDLKPGTGFIPHGRTTTFQNNGCEAGGRVYMAESTGATYAVVEYDVVLLTGDRAMASASGGSAEVMVGTPIKPQNAIPDITALLAAVAYLPTPLDLTPFNIRNGLGIDLATMIYLGVVAHNNNTGRAVYKIPIPIGLPLGLILPLQGFTQFPNSPPWYMSPAVSIELF